MKFLLVICFFPLATFAQSRTDYEQAIARFKKFYNANQADSICAMFSAEWSKTDCLWTPELLSKAREDHGKMKSFKYLGKDETDPEKVTVFKVVFEKETFAMSLTLHSNKTLGTFRFKTVSDEIVAMMKKAK